MDLVYGGGRLDRVVHDAAELLREWRVREANWGQLYLEHQPATPPDEVHIEDLAVTMLINSRVAGQAAAAVAQRGGQIELATLPDLPLHEATLEQRLNVADLIATMTSWPWIGASLATKTLHKKRPQLIPILDNQAIFGAYMNPRWPDERSSTETIKAKARIADALERISYDLRRPENSETWAALERLEPERSRIELFDMVWWIYFRQIEPVAA